MTIHFFTFSDRTQPSSRQRTFYTAEELEKRGYTVVIHEPTILSIVRTRWPKRFLLILKLLRSLTTIKKNDIIYLQRAVYGKYFFVIMVSYIKLFRRKAIFDFDDPVYVHSAFKTKTFCKVSSVVVVATHRQAQWARQFNKNVHLIYFVIDPILYEQNAKDYSHPAEVPTIGWLGTGPEHLHNLPLIVGPLKRLVVQKNIPFKFVFIGSFNNAKVFALFEGIPGLSIEFIDRLDYTDPEAAPKEVRKFDIGVVPHQMEGEWNQGKTSMKILEYMACAVPSIVSHFGEMPYIITDGMNGFLAANEDEWVEKLTRLMTDHNLREKIGKAGQRRVREEFTFDSTMPKMLEVIESLNGSNTNKPRQKPPRL